MIKIIATLCRLAVPADCHDVAVTNSDLQEGLTMTACMVGQPALAEWMKQYPAHRLAGWKCSVGGGQGRAI